MKKCSFILLLISILSLFACSSAHPNLDGTYTSEGGYTTYTITFSNYSEDGFDAVWETYTDISAPLSAGTRLTGQGSFVPASSSETWFGSFDATWYENNTHYISIEDTDNALTFRVWKKGSPVTVQQESFTVYRVEGGAEIECCVVHVK